MSCAACHTRQIDVAGTLYRVDGGPALIDFQSFLTEMIGAVGAVLASDTAFDGFAAAVLGPNPPSSEVTALRNQVSLWFQREDLLRRKAYGTPDMWGLGRLDAVSMIFNRLAGLDLGQPPAYLIPDNIEPADAPVRYPFLWNAWRQDKTQWPGFADNGNDLLGLTRNLGEVYGVFAIYRPVKASGYLAGINFLNQNSANFEGLSSLENMIKKIGAPRWPWQVDPQLAAAGQQVWNKPSLDNMSCASCHDERNGAFRSPFHRTWKTPLYNVGSDTREWKILGRTAKSGVLEGGKFAFFGQPIGKTDTAFGLLGFSVLGSIVQRYNPFGAAGTAGPTPTLSQLPTALQSLTGAFPQELRNAIATPNPVYESRVLYGIWAAAPYLHNGSVPTLADLLKPVPERPASFAMGSSYDLVKIGIAAQQPGSHVVKTTDCGDVKSGNSRCGHTYGTEFADDEKRALLEYLKTL